MVEGRARFVLEYFRAFARIHAPTSGSPLYTCLSYGVEDDPEMLDLAARCLQSQPPANVLYGAVHQLLLAGAAHELRRYYPDVDPDAVAPDDATYPAFRDFVAKHRDAVLELVESRLVQTHVVRRTTVLLHGFDRVFREGGQRPLSLVEVGASGGLNLQWDRFRHHYDAPEGRVSWGPEGAGLELVAEVLGEGRPDAVSDDLRVASRVGVDLNPLDLNDDREVLWLRALIFPEHVERHEEFSRAVEIARRDPAEVVQGDAVQTVRRLIDQAPDDTTLCAYASVVLYQFTGEARAALRDELRAAGRERPVFFVSMESEPEGACNLDLWSYRDGVEERERLAQVQPHGRWIRWAEES